MKKLTLFIFLFFTVQAAFAQLSSDAFQSQMFYVNNTMPDAIVNGGVVKTKRVKDEDTKGSPLIFENQWLEGAFCTNDTLWHSDAKIGFNYDGEAEELILKTGEDTYKRPDASQLLAFMCKSPAVEKKNLIFLKLKIGDLREQFYEVLHIKNKYTLVKRQQKIFRPATAVDHGLHVSGVPYDEYESKITYYLNNTVGANRGTFQPLKMTKKGLIEVLPTREKTIDDFCKKNKISGKITEQEAIKILEFLEEQ